MQFVVTVQLYDDKSAPSKPFFPDADFVFDLPHDAKQHLLALVADEIVATTETMCRWIDSDTLEVVQPNRPAPYQRRVFRVEQVSDED